MIDKLLADYVDLQVQEENLKVQKENLRQQIINILNEQGSNRYISADNISATISDKETFKYNDELGILRYLKENGYSRYVQEKIIATDLNKELKKPTKLTEALSSMFSKTKSTVLTVRGL